MSEEETMNYTFNRSTSVSQIELRDKGKEELVNVKKIEFSPFSVKKIENVLKKGEAYKGNQDILIDSMLIDKEQFEKLSISKNYSMECTGLMREGETVYAHKLYFGNVSFRFENATYQNEYVELRNVEMMMWPYSEYYNKLLED